MFNVLPSSSPHVYNFRWRVHCACVTSNAGSVKITLEKKNYFSWGVLLMMVIYVRWTFHLKWRDSCSWFVRVLLNMLSRHVLCDCQECHVIWCGQSTFGLALWWMDEAGWCKPAPALLCVAVCQHFNHIVSLQHILKAFGDKGHTLAATDIGGGEMTGWGGWNVRQRQVPPAATFMASPLWPPCPWSSWGGHGWVTSSTSNVIVGRLAGREAALFIRGLCWPSHHGNKRTQHYLSQAGWEREQSSTMSDHSSCAHSHSTSLYIIFLVSFRTKGDS